LNGFTHLRNVGKMADNRQKRKIPAEGIRFDMVYN